jgi:hypothetical protein
MISFAYAIRILPEIASRKKYKFIFVIAPAKIEAFKNLPNIVFLFLKKTAYSNA